MPHALRPITAISQMPFSPKARTAIEVLLLAVIVAFVAAIALGIFVDLFWASDNKPSEAFRGAFLGAFFAFLFVRLGDGLTKIYARQAAARNKLVELQHRLLEILNTVHDDLYIAKKLAEFKIALKSSPPVPIFMNKFAMLTRLGDLLSLGNIDLINELKGRDIDIRKLNDSMETWQKSYGEVKDAFIKKTIDERTYLFNAEEAGQQGQELSEYMTAVQQDLIGSLAAVRLLAEHDTLLGKIIQWTSLTKFPKGFEEQRASERLRILAEVREGDEGVSAVQALRNRDKRTNDGGTRR